MAKAATKASSRSAMIVEIGNDWLKMIQSDPAKGGFAVSRMHLERFESIGTGVAKSIAGAIKSKKFSNMPVIACLPRQAVTIRMLELPSTDLEEIGDMVELQINKQTPYSRDQILSDYRVVGTGREGYSRVMLAIVQRSALRERFYILEEAGLDVERMTVSTEGMLTWAAKAVGSSAPAVILDVDSFYSDFVVVGTDGLAYTRSILVGANQLLADPDQWREALAREALQSLETCKGDMPGLRINKLIVTGAGARDEGLAEFVGEKLGVAAEVRDSLTDAQRVPKTPALDQGDARAVSLTAMAGIGLSPDSLEFNLIPDSVKLRKGLEQQARGLTMLGIAVMGLLFASSLYLSVKLSRMQGRYRALEKKATELQPEYQRLKGMLEVSTAVRKRRDISMSAANALATLHPLAPENVFFESVRIDVEADMPIEIEGSAKTRADALRFVQNLEGSPLFADVGHDGIDRDPKTKWYRFKLKLRWEGGA